MSVFKLKIIDRLFFAELAKMMASVVLVLSIILLSQRLLGYLSKVSAGQLSSDAVLSLIGLQMILLLIKILPPALLVSILLVLGRMYRDNEMSALFSAGIGLSRVYRAIFLFVGPLCALALYLSLVIGPWAMQQVVQVKAGDQSSLDIRGISQGRFNEYSRGDLVFYVEKITDDEQMVNVFIQSVQHGKLGIISSSKGEIRVDPETGDRFIVLNNGKRYEGVPGQADYKVTEFEEYGVLVAEKTEVKIKLDVEDLPTSGLWDLGTTEAMSELQKRLSIPLALITFTVLAVPISRVSPRAGMYGNLLTGLLVYIVYENFMSLSYSWMMKGVLLPWIGVWWVHVLMILLGLALIVRSVGVRFVKKQWLGLS